jgi:hypothetical protein
MKKTFILLFLLLLILIAAIAFWPLLSQRQSATAAPEVFQSGINAGCYIAAPNVCKIHVDPFTINVDDGNGEKLVEFQVRANGVIIYHFKTDAAFAFRPVGDYTPSLVMQDFAATCGEEYFVDLLAKDTGNVILNLAAMTEQFTCPSTVP